MLKKTLSYFVRTFKKFRPPIDESLKLQIGSLQSQNSRISDSSCLSDREFKVFSQWGEDGIIQYLVHSIPSISRTFVEFGVDDYSESNTRFLLMNNFWSGLIIDGGKKHIDYLRRNRYDWKYRITAKSSFITAENINSLIESSGFLGQLGVLSVDLDGVDYWVLDAIKVVQPTIVIVEYNGFMGSRHAVTVPYRADFQRNLAHYSNFYWGGSLAAFHHLLVSRGFFFVGCNSAGNNAFFVSRDCSHNGLKEVSLEEGYRFPSFWEYRRANGRLDTTRDAKSFFREISHLQLIDVTTGIEGRVGDFDFGL